MRQLNDEKEKSIIEKVLPMNLATADTVINLFYNKDEEVDYCLYTDGNVEYLDTYLDDHPHQRDLFLEGCGRLKRLEFLVTNAKMLLIEKKRHDNVIKNLYIDEKNIMKVVMSNIYKVSSSENGKVMIKRMENINAN